MWKLHFTCCFHCKVQVLVDGRGSTRPYDQDGWLVIIADSHGFFTLISREVRVLGLMSGDTKTTKKIWVVCGRDFSRCFFNMWYAKNCPSIYLWNSITCTGLRITWNICGSWNFDLRIHPDLKIILQMKKTQRIQQKNMGPTVLPFAKCVMVRITRANRWAEQLTFNPTRPKPP